MHVGFCHSRVLRCSSTKRHWPKAYIRMCSLSRCDLSSSWLQCNISAAPSVSKIAIHLIVIYVSCGCQASMTYKAGRSTSVLFLQWRRGLKANLRVTEKVPGWNHGPCRTQSRSPRQAPEGQGFLMTCSRSSRRTQSALLGSWGTA